MLRHPRKHKTANNFAMFFPPPARAHSKQLNVQHTMGGPHSRTMVHSATGRIAWSASMCVCVRGMRPSVLHGGGSTQHAARSTQG